MQGLSQNNKRHYGKTTKQEPSMTTSKTKICTKCKIKKPFNEFDKDKYAKYGIRPSCKSCKKAYRKTLNKDAMKRYQKEYRIKYKEELSEKNKIRHVKNKERNNKISREYYQKNKEELLAESIKYYHNNKDRIKASKKEYRKLNYVIKRERLRSQANRMNRRASGIKEIRITTIRRVIKKYNSKCYWCDIYIDTKKKKSFHIDHYIPLSKGGANSEENLVLSCPFCNMSKGAKDPLEFAISKGKLL